MTGDDIPVRDHSPQRVSSSPQDQRVQAMNRNTRGMLPIGWGLGDSFGSITSHRAGVKSSSCNRRRERTTWNGSPQLCLPEAMPSEDNSPALKG
jgi:hypothetical protein